MTQVTNTSNDTTHIGQHIITVSSAGGVKKTAPITLAYHAMESLAVLADKILSIKSATSTVDDESVRKECLDYFFATPEGEAFKERYDYLKELGKLKTPEQSTEQKTKLDILNAANMNLQRTCDVVRGIASLKDVGAEVTIELVAGTEDIYACYVCRNSTGERQWLPFSPTQLQSIVKCKFTDADKIADVRVMASRVTSKAPNKDKGANGERIAQSKIGEAVTNLDTSLAAYTTDDGKLAVPVGGMKALLLFWARLNHTLTPEDKAAAETAYAEEAAKEDADVSPKTKAKVSKMLPKLKKKA